MANDKKEKQQGKAAQLLERIKAWFRGMKKKKKKVVWPTRKTTTKNVIVAVTVMVASGIVIWAFDQVAMLIVQTLISIGH